MFKKLSVILLFLLLAVPSWGQAPRCSEIYKRVDVFVPTEPKVLQQVELILQKVGELKLFETGSRKRRKELQHLREDMESIKGMVRSAQQDYVVELIKKWEIFNEYWISKIREFESLPLEKQNQLRHYLDLPLSLSTKHFISFMEARSHNKWQLNRLNSFLTLHEAHPGVSVEAALFLFNRQVLKFYSRWDFVKCRY